MTSVYRALQKLHAGFPLRGFTVVIFEAERRVTADLANFCDLRQNSHFVLLEHLITLLLDQLLHMQSLSIVEVLLFLVEMNITDLLILVRQITENILL